MKELKKLKGFWKIILILIAIYIVFGGLMFWFYLSGDKTKEAAGQFGDMFGGITALFGSLTFAGVLYTIILQRKELMLTRKELKYSRIAFEEQTITTKIQRLENTFFKMIDSIIIAKENIKCVDLSGNTIEGDRACKYILHQTRSCFTIDGASLSPVKYTGNNLPLLQSKYFRNPKIPNSNMSIYFSRINNLIELIATSDFTIEQKNFYIKILITNISFRTELPLLYYYFALEDLSVSEAGRNFIKQSQLFMDIAPDDLADISHLGILFPDLLKEYEALTAKLKK